jgi:hypothetical protein
VEAFKYFGTTLKTDQNSIQEEIKGRLNLGNACYHSVQNPLSSSLSSKNLKVKIYRNIILLVVLYECETWSLTLREKRSLRMFENRVLRRVFGPTRDEATGEWRKLYNEELNDLYPLPNIMRVVNSRKNEIGGVCGAYGRGERCAQGVGGEARGKEQLGRPRRKWEDNIKMDLKEVGGGWRDWMELGQDRNRWRTLVSTVKNLRVP